MATHTKHTILYEGDRPAFAVIPFDEYQALLGDDNTDDVLIPHEVVKLQVKHDCNLLGAWRRHRKMTQTQFGDLMGVSQAAVAQMEKTDNPHTSTLEKAAEVLACDVDQLSD